MKQFPDDFTALRQEYLHSILARCRSFEAAVALLQKGDLVDYIALRGEIHKLRGSGGFYGFPALSLACAAAEDYMLLAGENQSEPDKPLLAELIERVISAVKECAAASRQAPPQE